MIQNNRDNECKMVFVLGDSRTGTSSINAYLNSLGINSKHYYVKEAEQLPPDHENRVINERNLLKYIEKSGYYGFSDYPTRLYYKELFNHYPDAYFILTVRSSSEVWLKSMKSYFPKFNIAINDEQVLNNYINIHKDIERFFQDKGKFLKVSIDDDDAIISEEIKKFLDIKSIATIGRENTSADVDIENVTRRKTLYKYSGEDWIDYVENTCKPGMTLLSEKGWIYLINDSNDYYKWAYGLKSWDDNELNKVKELLNNRVDELLYKYNAKYVKFIIPEKSVVYNNYMPHIFSDKILSENRPAVIMDSVCDNVHYLEKYLCSLKGFGRLYFKGDSHTNWLGAYYIYQYIVSELSKMGVGIKKPLLLDELDVSIANYRGDLYTQVTEAQLADIHGVWGQFNLSDSLGFDISYSPKASYLCVEPPQDYVDKYGDSREVICTEIPNNNELPTAVVYRDSTCDFVQPFLSNHFKRVVYIWHKGNIYEDIIRRENPDVVINLMAERFVSNYYVRTVLS